MRSITSLNRKRIDHLSATMVRALENINNLAERIDWFRTERQVAETYHSFIHQIFLDAFTDVSILQDAIGNYLDQIQDRVIALTSLNHHLLTPSLVSPAQLQEALQGIEKELLRKYAPFKFGFDNLEYFYSVPSTTYLADDDYLYVEINSIYADLCRWWFWNVVQ